MSKGKVMKNSHEKLARKVRVPRKTGFKFLFARCYTMGRRTFADQEGLSETGMTESILTNLYWAINWKFKPTESFMVTDIVGLWSILALYHLCELQKGPFFTKTNFSKN